MALWKAVHVVQVTGNHLPGMQIDIPNAGEFRALAVLEFSLHANISRITLPHFHVQGQGCLTRRTRRFGRQFRTRTDGQTCPFVLFRRTSACKNFFTIFFFTVGNFSEADVSNQNPRWRRARADGCARAYVCQKNGSQWVVHRDCSSSGWII